MPEDAELLALALTVVGVLLLVSAALSRISDRIRIPVVLIFLIIGMLAGSEGIGRIAFDDYRLAFRVGFAALALILFDGGLNTRGSSLRRFWAPGTVLATIGVAATAAIGAVGARATGLGWSEAMLFGAVVSSTDAASVFAVLRASGLRVKRRPSETLEIESGLNDPAAVVLTMVLAAAVARRASPDAAALLGIPLQFLIGGGLGLGFGYLGRVTLGRLRLSVGGIYPVATLGIAFLSYGLTTALHGSGLLAVYLTGFVLGNGPLPYRNGIFRVHDFIAWFSQIVIFLSLGLLVFPSQLLPVAGAGLALALFLALVARPLAVALCLAPFRYPPRQILFIGLMGLRGAVPIVLAIVPILAGARGGQAIFNLVFFIVVVSAVLQGVSVRSLARWMRLETDLAPPPAAALEIISTRRTEGELLLFHIHPSLAVAAGRIADIPFPQTASVVLVVRGEKLIAARGNVSLQSGDYIYVLCRPEDRPFIHLLFGPHVGE